MPLIAVDHLNFEYDGKRVLFDVGFNIKEGSVTALVGPNGAGKTTLMRCLAGLETPLSGTIKVGGYDVCENPRDVHRLVGYLSDFFGLYNALTIRQCLTYMAWCHNIPDHLVQDKVNTIATAVGLNERMDDKAGTLSRGYRQRLGIGLSLVHDPKILLLDEPASGMDPEARIGLSHLMTRLRQSGMTIIVSSHILAELEDYCTDMLVIREGRVAEHVMLDDHKQITTRMITIDVLGATDKAQNVLNSQDAVSDIKIEETVITCSFSGDTQDVAALLKTLLAADIPIVGFQGQVQSLQSAYMNLVSRYESKEKIG
jgi:ABC-2 type transport system ATP-binding protein